MNQNSVVFYHNKSYDFKEVYDICTKLKLHIFECDKLDILAYIMDKISPLYVIFDKNVDLSQNIFKDFVFHNKKNLIYFIGEKFMEYSCNHVFIANTYNELESVISNHYRCFSKSLCTEDKNQSLCYSIMHSELDNLSFRPKLIGVKYITDLIYELYTNSSISHGKCNDTYNKLAIKYNTTSCSIEKSIRFCILRAYETCQNKSLFYNISKTEKAPSIKEVANYILDKINLRISQKMY